MVCKEESPPQHQSKVSNVGISCITASFILVNSSVGPGILDYPAAYASGRSILFTFVIQISVTVFLAFTMVVLGYCSQRKSVATFHGVISNMCGERSRAVCAVIMFLAYFGGCVTVLIVIVFRSTIGPSFCHSVYMNRKFTTAVTAILCIAPFCFLKRVDFLRHISVFGIVAMIFPLALMIYAYFSNKLIAEHDTTTQQSHAKKNILDNLRIIPVTCFSMQNHELIPSIYGRFRDRSTQSLIKVTVSSMIMLTIFYGSIGILGYHLFGDLVKTDVMQMFDANSPWVLVCMVALIVKVIAAYPLYAFAGREAIEGLYLYSIKKSDSKDEGENRQRRYTISALWFCTSLATALFVRDIDPIIQFVGVFALVNIFIFPGFCLVRIYQSADYKESTKAKAQLYSGVVTICFGLALLIGTTVENLHRLFLSPQDQRPPLCIA